MKITKKELETYIQKAVNHLINEWDVISICRRENAGMLDIEEKIEWFKKVLVDRVFDSDDYYDIQELIIDILSNEFYIDLEDNSDHYIAKDLYDLYSKLSAGEKDAFDKFLLNVKSTGTISMIEST